jgi:hypothetical protein
VGLVLLLPFYLGFTLKNGIIVAIFVCGKGIKKELFLEDSFERFFVDEKDMVVRTRFGWRGRQPSTK